MLVNLAHSKTETSMNKSTFSGSLKFSKKLPNPENKKITMKYIDNKLPLL